MHDSFIGFLEKWVRSFAYERLRNDELLYMRVSSLQTLPNLACEDRFPVREMPSSDLRTLSFWCFVNGPDLRNGHPHSQLEIAICSVVN